MADHDDLLTQSTQGKYFFDINNFDVLSLSRQKLGSFLENKVLQKLKFSKNANNKKCAPKMIFLNENNQKDSDNFRHQKLTLKV